MKRVLITGTTSYLGTHLAEALKARGDEVHKLLRPASDPHGIARSPFHRYDGSAAAAARALEAAQPHAIIHLASGGVRSTEAEQTAAGLTLPTQLMDAAVAAGVKPRVILAGSFWAWGENGEPNSHYAALKIAAREAASAHAAAGHFEACELVVYDTYGPRDMRGKLFHLLDMASRSGASIDMTPGEQLIAPLHVDDFCAAFLTALDLPSSQLDARACAVFSIPGPDMVSLRDAVAFFERATGRRVGARWGAKAYPPGQIFSPHVGEALPGWRPAISLERGLKECFGD